MARTPYTEMFLHRLGDLVRIQGYEAGKPDKQALTIDLKSGSIGLSDASKPLDQEQGAERILGVFGTLKLVHGHALGVISAAKKIAEIQGQAVHRVTASMVLTYRDPWEEDEKFAGLLRFALDPSGAGKGLFFSYGVNLTTTQQRRSDAKANTEPLYQGADPRFFFNRQLARSLIDAGVPDVERFVLPVIMGSVQQIPSVVFGDNTHATITLIARRSIQRPGVRHWRRGADAEGVVANFVETEQIVEIQTPKGNIISGFVQIRGSIPLLWSQIPNIKYKPTTRLAPPKAYQPSFDRHMAALLDEYKGIVAINLANKHGSEGVLSSAFQKEAERFTGSRDGLKFVGFDFHAVCGATRYDRLDLLWKEVQPTFDSFSFFASGLGLSQQQIGVFRTNCIDCLDRTNVVQGLLARKHLETLLRATGLLSDSSTLPSSFPKVEKFFRIMWANHGDDISLQYAGTGALKSGFTRTGVRTKAGLVDDGVKSGVRYYLNNFQDGFKQDALDLVTGAYTISKDKPNPFRAGGNPLLPLFVMVAAALFGVRNLLGFVLGGFRHTGFSQFAQQTVLPLGLCGVILLLTVKNGKKMVNRPALRPDLSQPW